MRVAGHCRALVRRPPQYLPQQRLNRMPYSFQKVIVVAVLLATFVSSAFSRGLSWKTAVALFDQQHWAEAACAFATLERQSPGKTDALLFSVFALPQIGRVCSA